VNARKCPGARDAGGRDDALVYWERRKSLSKLPIKKAKNLAQRMLAEALLQGLVSEYAPYSRAAPLALRRRS
jgi:hypothetical protein